MEKPEVMPKEESDTTNPPGISTNVVQVQAQIEKKEACKDEGFHGKFNSPWDGLLQPERPSSSEEQASQKPLTLPRSLCLSEWEILGPGHPAKTHG